MTRRSYDQYCGLAGALDLVGERWTMLVVRELMTGPKRYTDLADALPGIGTSLLASRLKQLADDGVVTRRYLEPPTASTVYELTTAGDELGRALMPLIQWGLRHAVPAQPGPNTTVRPEWSLVNFAYQVDPAALEGIDATYKFVIDGEPAYLQVRGGRVSIQRKDAESPPDATVSLDAATVAAIGSGRLSARNAAAAGRVRIEGDQTAVENLIRAFDGATP